jgi:succinate dehydrogenase hydrophobic anchor subunit
MEVSEIILVILALIFVYLLFAAKRSSINAARKRRDIVNKIKQRER